VLQRFAVAAAAHQFTQRRQFRFGQWPLEIEVKLQPRQAEQMRQQ
jgi:hypothetical protein